MFSFKSFFLDWIVVTKDSKRMKTLSFIFSIYATGQDFPDCWVSESAVVLPSVDPKAKKSLWII